MANSDGTSSVSREEVLELIRQKDEIERKLSDYYDVLKSEKVDLIEPLVDYQGYPRSDIDVHKVRIARNGINCLTNDHKYLINQIAKGLESVHETARMDGSLGEQVIVSAAQKCSIIDDEAAGTASYSDRDAFAVINHLMIGSPADAAGLKDGDLVLQFGTLKYSNFEDIIQVGELVKNSLNNPLDVKVLRKEPRETGGGGRIKSLVLTPKKWYGQGTLGCYIKSYDPTLDR